ncbi:hypothetical protein, conserved [Trypanosoma brucei brucei TREU927]|uniref:C2H2-type domain-containing protein n=1 Tax=Trypanosoma brucei brucei (strain 927/4 GUTat10.1) TaxID=185431 RepID=Q57U39_TRYB2|nr:hypothetical protein, conserved [Trypanosoma brucei brucei TREU927]AAX70879.1 hypothetical protein, conserved [Trypanosoma brucei]AAZ13565.1 hypothetical protein, conserved [Trypanosoma brucei brucei TREU927]
MCVYCAFDNEWLLLFHFYSSFTKEMRTRTTMTSGAPARRMTSQGHVTACVSNNNDSMAAKLRRCPSCQCYGCSAFTDRLIFCVGECRNCGEEVDLHDLAAHEAQCMGLGAVEGTLIICAKCCRGLKPGNIPTTSETNHDKEQKEKNVLSFSKGKCCKGPYTHQTHAVCRGECRKKNDGSNVSSVRCGGSCNGHRKDGPCAVCCDTLPHLTQREEGHVHCKGHVFECTTCGQVFMTAVKYAMHLCCGRTDPEPKSSTCGLSEDTVKDRGGCSYPTWETSCLSVSPLKGPAPHTPVATRPQSATTTSLPSYAECPSPSPSLLRAAAVKPPSRSFEKSSGASSGVLGGNQAKKSKSRLRGDSSTEARDDLGRRQPNKGIHAAEGTASSNFRVSGRAESVPRNRVSEEGGCSTGLVGRNNVWRPLPLFAGDGGRRMGPSRMSSAAGSLRSSVMDSRERDGEHGTTIWRTREAQPDSFIPIVEKTSPSHHQSHSATVVDCMGSSVSVTTINSRVAAPLILVSPCRKREAVSDTVSIEVITRDTVGVDAAVMKRIC